MNPRIPYVIGLDLGTGGARALAVAADGKVLSAASHPLPMPFMDAHGASEQVAESWKTAAFTSLRHCVEELRANQTDPYGLAALCVDGTSGTIVLLDKNNQPMYPGILHNDTRAASEADFLNSVLSSHCQEVGYRFGATFALSKILWFKSHHPLLFEKVNRILHQSDYIIAQLCGNFSCSDPSNALKTGYNLIRDAWPMEFESLGLLDLLPKVIPSGEPAGGLLKTVGEDLGLPAGVPVLTGLTDSAAAFLATGAVRPGEFSSCLGTTLAFKGVAKELAHDPEGTVYCHRHPAGGWLPGGASNVGGACLKHFYPQRNLAELDRQAIGGFPTETLCYPLVEAGERFPFNAPQAAGIYSPARDEADHFLSLLQGVGLVEKWCMRRFVNLGIPVADPLFATGKGAKSDDWCQIRANLLQMPLARSLSTDSAFGVAVLAASKVFYDGSLEAAGKAMTGVDRIFEPDRQYADWAEGKLDELQALCRNQGWLG